LSQVKDKDDKNAETFTSIMQQLLCSRILRTMQERRATCFSNRLGSNRDGKACDAEQNSI